MRLDGELVFVLVCLAGWVLLGGLALQISANRFFKKRISFKRAVLTQFAMIWILPIWTNAYFTKFSDRFIEPHPEINYLLPVLCLIPQFFIVMYSFKIRALPALVCLIISLVPCYAAFRLAMPTSVLVGGARPFVTKANGEMRSVVEKLEEWSRTEDVIPVPVNRKGEEVRGVPRSTSGEGRVIVYFEGSSFLPPEPFLLVASPITKNWWRIAERRTQSERNSSISLSRTTS